MRIVEKDCGHVRFDNGITIECDSAGDMNALTCSALNADFNEELIFENVPGVGFKFGSKGKPPKLVPCYAFEENAKVAVFYCRAVLDVACEEVIL